MKRTRFQELSNDIQAAIDTGNRDELDVLDGKIGGALADGNINLPEAGELTADIELGLDSLGRDGGLYISELDERTLDELENA
jgi:hypothetical protein